jgi:hypothetical protein
MSYLQQVLQPDESVRFRTNVHWFVYLPAIAALMIGLSLGGWYYWNDQYSLVLLLGLWSSEPLASYSPSPHG